MAELMTLLNIHHHLPCSNEQRRTSDNKRCCDMTLEPVGRSVGRSVGDIVGRTVSVSTQRRSCRPRRPKKGKKHLRRGP